MPTNLHQLIRYRTIDRALRDPENDYGWEELADACAQAIYDQTRKSHQISRRTIMYDIDNMRSGKLGYHAPIEYDRQAKSYYYSNSKFGINQVPLKSSDMDELKSALMILQQFSGKQGIAGIQQSITHLEECLNLKRRGRRRPMVQFDHSLNEPGQRWVNEIYGNIKNQTSFRAHYAPFDHASSQIIFSPYLLKEYDNRWYVIGYHHRREMVAVLGLDRITAIDETLTDYHREESFDAETYFRDVIGVSYAGQQERAQVILRVYGVQNKYVKTKPFHPSQVCLRDEDGYSDYQLEVVVNYELETLILGLGERAEVIQPLRLRKIIAKRAAELNQHYA